MEIEEIRKVNLRHVLAKGGRGYAKDLADLIGCEPSYLSQIKTDKKNMGSAFARQMEEAIEKPRGWMDTLNLYDYGTELRAIVESRLDVEGLSAGLDAYRSSFRVEESAIQAPVGKVPLISWVTAGVWEDPIDNYHVGDAEEWLPCPPNCQANTTFALTVTGESMDDGGPSGYRDGEMIFVDGSKAEPVHNADVIVKNGGGKVTFKRLINSNGDWFLKPLNPNWPDKTIPLDSEATIVGRVMFSGRMR